MDSAAELNTYSLPSLLPSFLPSLTNLQTSALSSMDSAAELQRRELDSINGYLRFKRVPMDLPHRPVNQSSACST